MINTLRSEWTKLATTTAFYWTTSLLVIFSLLWAWFVGANVTPDPTVFNLEILYPRDVVAGLFLFGLFICAIQAIMVVTSEYRHNYQSVTFLGTPNRLSVAFSKWLLYAFLGALATFITVVLSYYVAKFAASDSASSTLRVWQDENALRYMWVYPLVMALIVTWAQGVAWLLRQTAGAVAVMSLWILAFEDILIMIPTVGKHIATYGPMKNMQAFVSMTDIPDAPWGYYGSAVYFGAWAIAFFIAGIMMLRFRDA